MKKNWLAILLLWAGIAQAQFVKNTGIVITNSADLKVNSDWDNTNGVFTNNGTISTNDNWTSTGGYSAVGAGGFILTNTATKQFNHSGQVLGTLTKNGAGNTQIDNHLILTGNLTLTNGLLNMTGANDTIVMKANTVINGGSSNSYVVGKVTRYGNGDLFFPITIASNYMPITIFQVAGNNPRVTVTLQTSPGGYSILGAGNTLIPFPYVWTSQVVRGDTATYVEVQYPSALIATPANALVSRSVDPTHYASMGVQTMTTAGGMTKVKSYTRGLKGLFSVAQGALLQLDAPVASAATGVTSSSFTANWGAVNSAAFYHLYVSADNFATHVAGYNGLAVNGTNYAVTGVNPAITYKFRLTAGGTAPTSPLSNSIDVTTSKGSQTIAFATIADKVLGDPPFPLSGTASSGLTVSYISTSGKVTISGSQATLVSAGRATITASQAGNTTYEPATSLDRSFCIKPAKPTINVSGNNTDAPVLTSNSTTGNQWFLNGAAIPGATNATINVSTFGVYKVRVTADDCVGEFSSDLPIIVTGDLMKADSELSLTPNPAKDYLEVRGIRGQLQHSQVFDMSGRSSSLSFERKAEFYQGDIRHLMPGVYLLRLQDSESVLQVKFIKH